jgi:hypothetical protein
LVKGNGKGRKQKRLDLPKEAKSMNKKEFEVRRERTQPG